MDTFHLVLSQPTYVPKYIFWDFNFNFDISVIWHELRLRDIKN